MSPLFLDSLEMLKCFVYVLFISCVALNSYKMMIIDDSQPLCEMIQQKKLHNSYVLNFIDYFGSNILELLDICVLLFYYICLKRKNI